MWFAPTLHYLPVRLLIQQDEATYIDLMLDRAPLQADAAPRAPRPRAEPRRLAPRRRAA